MHFDTRARPSTERLGSIDVGSDHIRLMREYRRSSGPDPRSRLATMFDALEAKKEQLERSVTVAVQLFASADAALIVGKLIADGLDTRRTPRTARWSRRRSPG